MSLKPTFLSRFLLLAAVCVLPIGGLLAGETASDDAKDAKNVPQTILDDVTPLNEFEIDSSFVGHSGFEEKRFDGTGAGFQEYYRSIDEVQNSIEITRRIHLFDKIYLKLGAEYERFDFSTTTAPIPSTLQRANGIVALEYVVQGHAAVTLKTEPGVYFSHWSDINGGSFDIPIDLATVVPTPWKNVFGLVGVRFSLLSKYPAFPIVGLEWLISPHWRLDAIPPEPRLIYTVNKHFDLFVGGELLGEAYKTSYRDDLRPQEQRFDGAILDYSEERVGGGLTYNFNKALNVDFSGGWTIERDFDYYRPDASKEFITHGAPYAKIEISAEF